MEPYFSKNDKLMFYKYLDKAQGYFEYGSGGSTYQACIRKNVKSIYSVESDKKWYEKMKKTINNQSTSSIQNLKLIYNEMNTPSNNWGYPGKNASKKQLKKYSNRIKKIGDDNQKNIDLVLIDGRFRVACCLKAYQVIPEDCKIAFDDFLTREHYHIVLQFYNIVDKTKDNRMVILEKKKSKKTIPISLIKKYELIPS